jgi:hypothetical protein
MLVGEVRALSESWAEVPDPRKRRGKRHPLGPILSLACVALLCGCDSVLAIAEWGRGQRAEVVERLGFTRRRTPCVATLHRVFRDLDVVAFEAVVGRWAEAVLATWAANGALPALAIDGKTVRGSRTDEVPARHLLSAVSHHLGVVFGQRAVGEKTNEIGGLPELLADLVLTGRVVTVDALLTQREVAATSVDKGGTI